MIFSKVLVIFLRLIISLVFKSLATLLNISKDKGLDFISFALGVGIGSR